METPRGEDLRFLLLDEHGVDVFEQVHWEWQREQLRQGVGRAHYRLDEAREESRRRGVTGQGAVSGWEVGGLEGGLEEGCQEGYGGGVIL